MNDQVGPLKEIIEKLLNEYVSKKDESIKEQTNKNNDQNNIIEAVYKEHPDWKNKIENKTDMYKEEYKNRSIGKNDNEKRKIKDELHKKYIKKLYVEIPDLKK